MNEEFGNSISPQIERGKIILYTNGEDDIDVSFIKIFCKKLGYTYHSEYGGGYLIETPIGEELEVGEDFIGRYPEFFESYERRDLRYYFITSKIDKLLEDVSCIEDYIEYTDNRRFINPIKFNSHIDKIVNELESLKV